jgi:hypothetical protein
LASAREEAVPYFGLGQRHIGPARLPKKCG